jgi:hypothetical protein
VLWALGSMLGAMQTVDMISSLRNNYGRVDVAVLKVDLILESIVTVVIWDWLFLCLFVWKGTEMLRQMLYISMEVDEGNSGAGPSEGRKSEGKNDKGAPNEKERSNTNDSSAEENKSPNNGKKVAEEIVEDETIIGQGAVHGMELDTVHGNVSGQVHGTVPRNDVGMGVPTNNESCNELDTVHGTVAGQVHGTVPLNDADY